MTYNNSENKIFSTFYNLYFIKTNNENDIITINNIKSIYKFYINKNSKGINSFYNYLINKGHKKFESFHYLKFNDKLVDKSKILLSKINLLQEIQIKIKKLKEQEINLINEINNYKYDELVKNNNIVLDYYNQKKTKIIYNYPNLVKKIICNSEYLNFISDKFINLEELIVPHCISLHINLNNYKFLIKLDYSYSNITHLNYELPHLKYINISNTYVQSLVESSQLLEVIDITNTYISSLPKNMIYIKKLYIQNTHILNLDNYLNLTILNLNNCSIENLPCDLPNIIELYISNTRIRRLPDTYKNLQILDCSYTNIEVIPDYLSDSLLYLYIHNTPNINYLDSFDSLYNVLSTLPILKKLIYLNCANSKLININKEFIPNIQTLITNIYEL